MSERGDDWDDFLSPLKKGDERLFRLNPLVLEVHANEKKHRRLEKEVRDYSIVYRVYDNLENIEEDPTQFRWRMDYGVEYFMDGSTRPFVNYIPEGPGDRENAARNIGNDIFPELERRSREFYGGAA